MKHCDITVFSFNDEHKSGSVTPIYYANIFEVFRIVWDWWKQNLDGDRSNLELSIKKIRNK